MESEVPSVREIELEARFRRVQTGTLEAVQQNGELLQVLAQFSLKTIANVLQKLAELNEELSVSDSTVSDLETGLEQVRNESQRLTGLMEQSLLMTLNLETFAESADVKSLEREMWGLERECRLFSSSPSRNRTRLPPPARLPTSELRDEILTAKEQVAELKRQIEQFTQSPMISPTFSHHSHSRQSTAEHHHHHYYYGVSEFQQPLPPAISSGPTKIQETPIHTKFFRELPTPPSTASTTSSLSLRHERFNSALTWAQIEPEPDMNDLPQDRRRRMSHESITVSSGSTLLQPVTPKIKRSASHESILDPTLSPSFRHISSPHQSPRSSPLSSSATSSPTYLSASAYLRQNNTSSLLLLSSARGKQSRGLSSRKSFWNLWDKTNNIPRSGRGRFASGPPGLGSRVVVCTEVDVGMLQDALEG